MMEQACSVGAMRTVSHPAVIAQAASNIITVKAPRFMGSLLFDLAYVLVGGKACGLDFGFDCGFPQCDPMMACEQDKGKQSHRKRNEKDKADFDAGHGSFFSFRVKILTKECLDVIPYIGYLIR